MTTSATQRADLPGEPSPADRDQDLRVFLQLEAIADLRWPDEVVRQWLYDHGRHLEFLRDYEDLDLERIRWKLEDVPVSELESCRGTGPMACMSPTGTRRG